MSCAVPVDLRERLEVLFWQEITSYRTNDYLRAFHITPLDDRHPTNPERGAATIEASASFGIADEAISSGEQIKQHWRDVICEWAFNRKLFEGKALFDLKRWSIHVCYPSTAYLIIVVDHFDLPRERVSVFANLLDRYLQKYLAEHPEGMTKKHFQLVSLTCLYLTIKLDHKQGFLSIELMIHLSREKFSKEQMVCMEKEILRTLAWKLHPPTPHVFLNHFLLLLEPGTSVPHDVIESARFFMELAALDYHCVPQRPSRIALAALLNAMKQEMVATALSVSSCVATIQERQYNLLLSLIAPSDRETVDQCRSRLMDLFNGVAMNDDVDTLMPAAPSIFDGRNASPVSVAHPHPLD
jgi:Cyclin, N-terminal domain/Cyclin, C-terminal domain